MKKKRQAQLLNATESQDSDEEAAESDEDREVDGAGGRFALRSCTCCLATLCVVCVSIILVGVLAVVFANVWVKASIEFVGTAAVGTKVTVESVDLGLYHGHVSISGLSVASPDGLDAPDPLFHLGGVEFDMDVWSVMPLVMGNQQKGGPLVIHQLTIQTVNVSIYQTNFTTSNAGIVTGRLIDEAKALYPVWKRAGLPDPKNLTQEQKEMLTHGVIQALSTKVIVGKIVFADLGVSYCFKPLCETAHMGPAKYELEEVRLEEVGKQRNGVYVIELILDLITAITMAVLKTAPRKFRLPMLKSMYPLPDIGGDCKHVMYNTGHGLVKITSFMAWSTYEFNMIPLKVAAMNAKLGIKSAEFGAKASWETTKLGAKANWEAAKLGAKANLGAAKVGVGAAELGVKANVEAAKLGAKAGMGAAKMGAKATMGAAHLGASMFGKLASLAGHTAPPPPPPPAAPIVPAPLPPVR